jgi:hypothetical protein
MLREADAIASGYGDGRIGCAARATLENRTLLFSLTFAVSSFSAFEERSLAAVRLENHSQRCAALLLKQGEQLLHVLSADSKVHGIDAEPSLAFEFCRRNPEFAALLDSLDHSGGQLLRIVSAQRGGAKADADGRHGRPAGGGGFLHCRIFEGNLTTS